MRPHARWYWMVLRQQHRLVVVLELEASVIGDARLARTCRRALEGDLSAVDACLCAHAERAEREYAWEFMELLADQEEEEKEGGAGT